MRKASDRRNGAGQPGFTLLELLVAIAVFSVMAALGYRGLSGILDARLGIDARQNEFARVVSTVSLFRQDVENAVSRSVRDEFGDSVPALRGGIDGALLELTRHAPAGRFRAAGVDLLRIEYRLEGDRLLRLTWDELDRFQGSVPRSRVMLTGVESFDLRFFDDTWTGFWPLERGFATLNELPAAVEVSLRWTDGRTLRRTFLLEG